VIGIAVRRGSALVLTLVLLLAGLGAAGASHLPGQPKKHRIVYHLSEPGVDRARFVLGNMENHVAGVGGWSHVEALELVVHGPALRTFVTATMDPEVKRRLGALQDQGAVLGACGNTMKAFQITLAQLPEGTRPLPQGGVVRVMELQEQGYVYIRP
jgi:hypothetical protein